MATLTFLFTDIESSTRLLRRVGEAAYAQVLADHRSLIRSIRDARGGEEVDTQGDGLFMVFSSPRAAVAAALDMQRALSEHTWPGDEQVRVRMGLHTGEADKSATGLVGLDVHRAARIAAAAHGGQVVISETCAALLRDSLPPGVALSNLGVHRLKDLGTPEQLFQLRAAGLQTEFPPLRSLGNPALSSNLPAELTPFIGRERELSEIRPLVSACRLVTLTGAGGSGKTRLSLQVAAELLDSYGDGVWLVELAAVSDERAVAPAISEALRLAGQPGPSALDNLLDALAFQQTLIVLDNCEHLIGACAKTADAILRSCPQVRLIATSREPLGISGETIYRVPSLSLPPPGEDDAVAPRSFDAVALFLERARAHGVNLTADAQTAPLMASICRRLDGMPLAIELAAARLHSLSLTSLSERLDQRFGLLTRGSRAAPERQQTLEATVAWSVSLLTSAERVLLRRLSVFPESFDLDAAEKVGGFGDIESFEITDLLGSLTDKNLVVAEPAGQALRYRMLETIRQFAAERLVTAGEDEAVLQAAHCEHYLRVAEMAAPHLTGPDQGTWFSRLAADQANLRYAAEHAARRSNGTGLVLRFATALRRYWMARLRVDEAVKLLMPVLERPEAARYPVLLAEALGTAANLARFTDLQTALRLGDRAVRLSREAGDERVLIEALAIQCSNYYFAEEPKRGLPLGREAVSLARQLHDDVALGSSLLGYLLPTEVLDPAGYDELAAEAIACTDRSGDRLIAYLLRNNAGVRALADGNIRIARANLQSAAAAMREIGVVSYHVPVNLGWVLRQEGDRDGARSAFAEGLRTSRRSGQPTGIAYAILGLACFAADLGEWYRAGMLHGAAQQFLQRGGEPWQNVEARYRQHSIAAIRASLGDERAEQARVEGTALSPTEALDLAHEVATGCSPKALRAWNNAYPS